MDGVDLTKVTSSLSFYSHAGEPPRLTLTLLAEHVTVNGPAEVVALLLGTDTP